MLKFIRQAQSNWLIKAGLLAIAASFFVGFLVLPAARQGGAEDVVAEVGNQRLYRRDVADAVVRLRARYRDQVGEAYDQLKDYFEERIPQQAFDQLIDNYATEEYVKSLGFGTSADELRRVILDNPNFQVDGKFSKKRYERFLSSNRMTDTQFESELSRDLALNKFQRFLASQVKVSEAEVQQRFVDENTKVEIEAFTLASKDLAASVSVSEDEVKTYYDEHAVDYFQPEKRKISYLSYDGMGAPYWGLPEANEFSDEALKAAYDAENEKFTLSEKNWRVAHIYYSWAKRNDQDARSDEQRKQDALKRAQAALAKLKAGSDFTILANTDSDDASAKRLQNGGLIQDGYAPASYYRKKVAEKFMSMKPGEVSDIVESKDGYHILKLLKVYEAGSKKDLADVENLLKTSMRQDRAAELAQKDAELGYAESATKSLEELAKAREGLNVREASITREDVIPGVGRDEALLTKIFDEMTPESGAILHQSNRRWVIVKLLETIEPEPKPLSEVRGQIEDLLKQEKARTQAAAELEKVRAEVAAGAKGTDISKKHKNVVVIDVPAFSRIGREKVGENSGVDVVPQLGASAKLKATLFSLKEGEVTPEVYELGDKVAFARIKKRVNPDPSLFEAQTDAIRSKLRSERFEGIYSEWTQRAREAVKVEIHVPVEELVKSFRDPAAQS
ncbi:MAG: SurA N-terminal domain-containing protein [Chrysiogenetes bacterium]|nr:SurA N-terminal domain-containing protein [Chrysiogenetes bacterium]